MIEYLIGVDGGGTGTRVRLARNDGVLLATGSGGPSGLMHGVEQAWSAVLDALHGAFSTAGLVRPALDKMAIGLGLAGVNNRQWAADFSARNPGFGDAVIETDAFTTLVGAHQGQPGVIIAIGTGSVGEVLTTDGQRREVGGWGFPASDEAGGAWLGMRAITHAQQVLDGRAPGSDFSRALMYFCDRSNQARNVHFDSHRDSMFAWLASASQTAYAQVAPLVIQHAESDPAARQLMLDGGREVAKIAAALDPGGELPIALCGGIAAHIQPYLPEPLLALVVKPHADAAAGALRLIDQRLKGYQTC
ncbi:N-acetylglucosamine kinase of eukaryotic type [Collimonas arenae]|uniref:N-acetylglucosamine kinase of eukaryotic type n=1 Tax=Collimonas arenae TaxID=279058 RepID=A0A0A1FD56_9BURK|nr:BadF/BadG/BcrA/BcrD ATPase family protein [Collimonas arenae]AIY40737.1 N-acetylglucosamine kinase of eukaryotic type [Collimonas arenae]